MARSRIVVVGAGVTGTATARHLAQAGHSVVLVERESIGHTRGSSHGTSRIFRLAYPDPALVALAREALTGWTRLEEESGEELMVRTGSLVVGSLVEGDAAALATAGAVFERLTGREVGRRWPVATEPDEPVLFQPDGAVILADRVHRALADAAVTAGGELVEHADVVGIDVRADGARVVLPTGEIEADAIVVTAGAWAPALLDPLGIELAVTVTRETVAHYALAGAQELPVVIDGATPGEIDGVAARPEQITYALYSPGIGLKAGLHDSGPVADPDASGQPQDDVIRWTSAWARRRFPQLDPSPVAAETCLYASTRDAGFVLERHGRVVIGSACSGHGFKFAPAIGRRLADLALAAARP